MSSVSSGEKLFDKALANGHLEANGEVPYLNGHDGAAASSALDDWAKDEEAHEDIDPEEEGWELDAGGIDARAEPEATTERAEDAEDGAGAGAGVNETDLWVRNSPFPADHVAAGSFESAMQV